MSFFLSQPFWIFVSKKKKILLHLNKDKQPVHMRYHLFLQYGWFLQNLGKDFIRTNMHTTVCAFTKMLFSQWFLTHYSYFENIGIQISQKQCLLTNKSQPSNISCKFCYHFTCLKQCNLDLMTLLTSPKTVTKSHNVTNLKNGLCKICSHWITYCH